ncbi:rhomboid family intramembrane serine protease [Massilia sp. GCM10023247]|uniref:rhomboid family intramembrane serine protease n=1 Tax=Massilia sp. GCM10023247 TaxID=3252643 RepID=UPI00360B91E0
MEDTTISWKVNRHATFVALRTRLLLIILCAVVSAPSFAFVEGRILYPRLAILVLFFSGMSLALLRVYFLGKVQPITISGDSMRIPRLAIKPVRLRLTSINSVHEFYSSKEMTHILVGQKEQAPIIIERRIFHSQDDFYRCVRLLSDLCIQNQTAETAEQTAVVSMRRVQWNVWVADMLAVLLALLYVALSTNAIEHIDDDAVYRGALTKHIFASGEYYRFLASFHLHLSPFHLGLNIIALSIVGRHVVALFGTARFTNIVFLSAICGSLLSMAFSQHQLVIGASGGIMGLIAAHLYACAKFRGQLPGNVSIPVKPTVWILALQTLLDLTWGPGDVFSHLGGFAFGLLHAWWSFRNCRFDQGANPSRTEVFVSLILAICSFLSLRHVFP